MIQNDDILNMNFYKKEKFTGSYQGMRYLIQKDQEEDAEDENVKHDIFRVTIWPGPYNFASTADDLKSSAVFPFTPEGKEQAERTVECAPHRMARPLNQSLSLYEHLADSLSLHRNTASKKATYEVYIFVHGFSYSIPIHGNARKTRKLHAVFCALSPALLRVTGA